MPPKRKARESAGTISTPAADEDSPMVDAPDSRTSSRDDGYDILKDPWTDEQETSLFKGIVRWKPAGMHKHFRMIALSMFLRNHGYDPKIDVHTRIPGIWEKLGRLYNMPVIDAREDSFDEDEDETPNMSFTEFSLTPHILDEDDDEEEEDSENNAFRKLIYDRVKAKAVSEDAEASPTPTESSPPPQTTTKKRKRGEAPTKTRASTVDDTDEARTSPIAASPTPTTKTGRAARSSKRAAAIVKAGKGDKPSKDTEDEDDDEDEEQDEDEDEDDEEDDDDEDDEDAEDAGTPEPKTTRGNKKGTKAAAKSKATASATKKNKPKRKR